MKKYIAPLGSKMSLTDLTENIQIASNDNLVDLLTNVFDEYGTVYSGLADTSLELSQYSPTSIIVAAGRGLCESHDVINVQDSDLLGQKTLSLSDPFDGLVYIKHLHVTGTPLDIVDGFYWSGSGQELTSDSIQADSYELTTINPGVSGIELANVVRSGTTITVTDHRPDNRLVFKDYLLSDYTYDNLHLPNTDTGTTALEFLVGVGHPDYGSGAGIPVKLDNDTPLTPLNPKIIFMRIYSNTILHLAPASYRRIPRKFRDSIAEPYASVTFEWGYQKVTGVGGVGQFTIQDFPSYVGDQFRTFTEDQLVGYYLYDVSYSGYEIISNDVTDGGGHTFVEVQSTATLPDGEISIGQDVDEYNWELKAYTPITEIEAPDENMQGIFRKRYTGRPPCSRLMKKLNLQWKYKLFINAKRGTKSSPTGTTAAGTYYDGGVSQNYASPFVVQFPDISMSGASVTAVPTEYGFEITIAGMTTATDFEVVYVNGADPDFENVNHPNLIINDRVVKIQTTTSDEYKIKVRPLHGGQVVSPPGTPYVETSIVSGGGGYKPNDKLLTSINVNLFSDIKTLESLVDDGGGKATLTYSGVDWDDAVFQKDIIKDTADHSYRILSNTDNVIKIRSIGDGDIGDFDQVNPTYIGSVDYTDPGNNYIPREVRRRLIYDHTFPNDVILTKCDFDCTRTDGTSVNPAIIRFYQEGYDTLGKYIEVSGDNQLYDNLPLNFEILGTRGKRVMVIDAWDPSGGGSNLDLVGTLTVHYRDKTVETFRTRQTAYYEGE